MKKLIFCLAFTLPFLFSCNEKQPAQKPEASEKKPVMNLPDTLKISADTAKILAKPKYEKPAFDPFAGSNKWVLIQLKGKRVAINREKQAFLVFDPAGGRVKGNGSCNSFSGSYSIEGDRISFKEMAVTRMACPDMTTEDAFLDVLSKAQYYKANESELLLLREKDSPLAVFTLIREN